MFSIRQQESSTRDVHAEGRAGSNEQRMASALARVAVRRFNAHESVDYPGDAALYHEGLGRCTLSLHLGLRVCLDALTHQAGERQENGCQHVISSAALANYCVGSHNSSLRLRPRLTTDCNRSSRLVTPKSLFPAGEIHLQRIIAALTRTEAILFKKDSSNPAPEQAAGWSRHPERTLDLVRASETWPFDSVPRTFRLLAVIRAIDQGCCEGCALSNAIRIVVCAGAN